MPSMIIIVQIYCDLQPKNGSVRRVMAWVGLCNARSKNGNMAGIGSYPLPLCFQLRTYHCKAGSRQFCPGPGTQSYSPEPIGLSGLTRLSWKVGPFARF